MSPSNGSALERLQDPTAGSHDRWNFDAVGSVILGAGSMFELDKGE